MANLFKSKVIIKDKCPLTKDVGYQIGVMYVGLGALQTGDVLDIRSHLQATNENTFTVAWNMFTTLNDGGIQLVNKIDYSTGRNLLRGIHHDGLVNMHIHECTQNYNNAYVGMFITAKPLVGSGPVKPNSVLDINYGTLTVLVHKKDTI